MTKSIEALNYPLLPDEAYTTVGKDYQDNVNRTQMNDPRFTIDNYHALLLRDVIGISGEAGELLDLFKKVVYHGKPLTTKVEEKMREELGDILWYIAALCNDMGWNLGEIMEENIEKLQKRFPDGWNKKAAEERKDQG